MRTCDGIFSANFAAAWLKQQGCGEMGESESAEAEATSIFSMSGVDVELAIFFPGARKFSRLLLDNARTSAPEKNSARHEISTEAVDNFWITQA
jgi:hypothetical protein